MTTRRTMLGQRVADETEVFEVGDYGKLHGIWYGRPPGPAGLASFAKHEVVEHDNGAITVSPSILVTGHDGGGNRLVRWHGYLRRGFWEWDEEG